MTNHSLVAIRLIVFRTLTTLSLLCGTAFAAEQPTKPNVVIILADDLGYGDVGCYGATKIKTPNIDRLATEGRCFMHAYTPGSVCSPTRYGLMAGRYFWREPRHHPTGVHGPGAPLLFPPERLTLAKLFQNNGYATGAVGKWHLGFGEGTHPKVRYDFTLDEMKPGPLESGFDWFFGMAANVGNEPRIHIENRRFAGRRPGDKVTVTEVKGQPLNYRPWSPDAEYKPDLVAGDIAKKAVEFIGRQKNEKPFFLYVASNIPHNDITPSASFAGKSGVGAYGDFVEELDAHVGQILDALSQAGVLDNTLLLFTSDNGGVVPAGDTKPVNKKVIPQWEARQAGHLSCGALRGSKHSIYEGGFRVPFIVRWPGTVPAGTRSDAMLCLNDVLATCADFLGEKLPTDVGEDSLSALAAWSGARTAQVRDSVILDSANGIFAIREGDWKLIARNENLVGENNKPMKNSPENQNQLYNLATDPSETQNLWAENPAIVTRLTAALAKARQEPQTRPQAAQQGTLELQVPVASCEEK